MPSVSERQAHFMAAVSHGWQPAGRHVNVKVAKEFHAADKKQGKYEHTIPHKRGNNQSSDHMN
jgi:hypothetical protein